MYQMSVDSLSQPGDKICIGPEIEIDNKITTGARHTNYCIDAIELKINNKAIVYAAFLLRTELVF